MLLRVLSLITAVALVGCKDKRKPNIELIQDMMKDPSFKAQDYDPDKADKRANMLPPPGTVPMGWDPYPSFQNDEQAKGYQNPIANLKGEQAKNLLAQGQRKYQTYCTICHGSSGYGDGNVADKMIVKPPSLMSEKIRSWTDGQIYHLITKGRGLMGGYEAQIPSPEDRWAIVNYIRHLQKNQKVDNAGSNSNQ
jgi:mono/diheme cytochrome c family protein